MGEHASDDRLEEYCLGRVPAVELEDFESHLLICQECQERLQETDLYIRTMRRAIVALRPGPAARVRWRDRLRVAMQWPKPMFVGAGIGALLLLWSVGPMIEGRKVAAPAAVMLEATRGGADGLRAHAPEKTPLDLTLDLTGVAMLPAYQVKIVDANGAPVMQSAAQPVEGKLALRAPGRLRRGMYWVRVYDKAEPGAVLREYGLELE